MTIFTVVLVVVFFEFFILKTPVYNPAAKIASVTKNEWWYSTLHEFSSTVEVTNNGTGAVDSIIVVIRFYHDPMEISWPVTKYTNEVQAYGWDGNILHFGTIPAGGNETESTNISVDDLYGGMGGGMAVPINYAEASILLGNRTLDKQTPQFDRSKGYEQTWFYP